VRHGGSQENVHSATGRTSGCIPPVVVQLLDSDFLFVQLPVFVDRDRFPAVDESLDMRDKWFSACLDFSTNIFPSIGRVILILSEISNVSG